MTVTPKLAVPFHVGRQVAVVEQDSREEILACVDALVRTREGTRIDDPEYGLEPLEFRQATPRQLEDIRAALEKYEPRASTQLTQSVVDRVVTDSIELEGQ